MPVHSLNDRLPLMKKPKGYGIPHCSGSWRLHKRQGETLPTVLKPNLTVHVSRSYQDVFCARHLGCALTRRQDATQDDWILCVSTCAVCALDGALRIRPFPDVRMGADMYCLLGDSRVRARSSVVKSVCWRIQP